MNLTPEQCRAARGLLDWTQEQLAEAAGVSRSTVRDFEKERHHLNRSSEQLIVEAFERAGVMLIAAAGEGAEDPGAGVRLASAAPR